jgi:hypothetical protein
MYPVKSKLDLGNNAVGTDCVEFKPVENPKVFVEAGSLAIQGGEKVTIFSPFIRLAKR